MLMRMMVCLRCVSPAGPPGTPPCHSTASSHTHARATITHTPNQQTTKAWGHSTPDVTLTGHKADAQFPLATAATEPLVASGVFVCLWMCCVLCV